MFDELAPFENEHFLKINNQSLSRRFTWREALFAFKNDLKHSGGQEAVTNHKKMAM
jgi:hypothetical protein